MKEGSAILPENDSQLIQSEVQVIAKVDAKMPYPRDGSSQDSEFVSVTLARPKGACSPQIGRLVSPTQSKPNPTTQRTRGTFLGKKHRPQEHRRHTVCQEGLSQATTFRGNVSAMWSGEWCTHSAMESNSSIQAGLQSRVLGFGVRFNACLTKLWHCRVGQV